LQVKLVSKFLAILGWAVAMGVALASDHDIQKGSLKVNVNTATFDELLSIPGVGKEIACEIFAEREFKLVDNLTRVDGIGNKNIDSIRPYVKVEGKTERRNK
jgi:competence ComEA-like helix-hairpin-helix protein